MIEQLETSEHKHHQSNQDGNKNPSTIMGTRTITNIYYDCLERILEFLDRESLLNLADTSKRMQIAAAAKFSDDFGKMTIQLKLCDRNQEEAGIFTYSDKIVVVGFKFCFPFLRCFGNKISDLYLDFYKAAADSRITLVDRYINRYCSDTLTKICIEIENLKSLSFEKQFKEVQQAEFVCVNLQNKLPNLMKWLPNVQNLELMTSETDTANAVCFPYLKALKLHIYGENTPNADVIDKISFENASNLLQANPDLQALHIFSYHYRTEITFTMMLDMIAGNTSLSELTVFFPFAADARDEQVTYDVRADEITRFANEHRSIVTLNFLMCQFTADDAIIFIRQLPSLKVFSFQFEDVVECDSFINQLDDKWKHNFEVRFNAVFIRIRR